MMNDKYKTCKDCPGRYCGCHSECEGYLSRRKAKDDLNEKIRAQKDIDYYFNKKLCRTRRNKM